MLNHNSSFLLDITNKNFIIFKRPDHASFTLNMVNFPKILPHWSPTEPTEGLTVHPDPRLHFISQFMQNTQFYSFLTNALKQLVWFCRVFCNKLKHKELQKLKQVLQWTQINNFSSNKYKLKKRLTNMKRLQYQRKKWGKNQQHFP